MNHDRDSTQPIVFGSSALAPLRAPKEVTVVDLDDTTAVRIAGIATFENGSDQPVYPVAFEKHDGSMVIVRGTRHVLQEMFGEALFQIAAEHDPRYSAHEQDVHRRLW